jgi:hypothetical protein
MQPTRRYLTNIELATDDGAGPSREANRVLQILILFVHAIRRHRTSMQSVNAHEAVSRTFDHRAARAEPCADLPGSALLGLT